MTIYDLMSVFDDSQEIRIYDLATDDCTILYEGEYRDCPEEYDYYEVSSVDNLEKDCILGINICTEDDD